MSEQVPIPIETLAALYAAGREFSDIGMTAVHCRFTSRVVVMEVVARKPHDLKWTDPMPADEAEVLLAQIRANMEGIGLVERAGPVRH